MKEKQIEEILNALKKSRCEENDYGDTMVVINKRLYEDVIDSLAELKDIIENGGEFGDKVVILKEHFERMTHLAYFGYEDVKKATAEKILNKLLNCHGHISKEHEGEYSYKLDKEAKYMFVSKAFIIKVMKEYGVEIKE